MSNSTENRQTPAFSNDRRSTASAHSGIELPDFGTLTMPDFETEKPTLETDDRSRNDRKNKPARAAVDALDFEMPVLSEWETVHSDSVYGSAVGTTLRSGTGIEDMRDAVTESIPEAAPDPAMTVEPGETLEEESSNPILDIRSGEEDVPELESAYIRRVAAREANRSRRNKRRSGPAIPDEPEGLAPSALPDEIDEDIDAELETILDEKEKPSFFSEKIQAPLIRFLAIRRTRKTLREQEAASWPQPVDIRQTPELPPKKASRFYRAQLGPLRLRLLLCVFLTLVALWIGCGLPLSGSLRSSPGLQAGVSLVFLLAAMVCALDIVTAGVRQFLSFQASLEALCASGCLFAAVDCIFVMAGLSGATPYCGAACLTLCAALLANYCKCLAAGSNLNAPAKEETVSVLTAEQESSGDLPTLIRSERNNPGIVRRSEQADGGQMTYSYAAPALMILSLALGIISTIGSDWALIVHHISAYYAVACSAAGFLCFALPYLVAVIHLRKTGSSIAGWAGCADIGRSHRVIVTDTDMFPTGTIRLAGVSLQEGESAEKAVSYLVSLLTVSGSSVTEAFGELMERRRYSVLTVENFKCHDGGGLSAYIHGEYVLAGSSGFLNLSGIRIPRELDTHNAICLAVSNELIGVFSMKYTPVKGVQYALNLLTQGKTQPVFAIRDFNITPLMIQELFKIPAINFEFPSFRERYRLSSLSASKETEPAAVLHRPGIRCAVETAEIGRKLYLACILGAAASVFSALIGFFFVFMMLRNGGAASVSCGKMLAYSLLWMLPVCGAAFWTGR